MINAWLPTLALSITAALSVSLWTLRVTLAARSRRLPASTVAVLEAVLFTFAFSHVSQHLGSPARVAGYAVGVGAGTYLGMVIDQRLSVHLTARPPGHRGVDGGRGHPGWSGPRSVGSGLPRVRVDEPQPVPQLHLADPRVDEVVTDAELGT
jgi:Domain of unknown function (DUF5698)